MKNKLTVMLSRLYSASQPLAQKRRDPEQQRLRMTYGGRVGFTLIELLVVVLIIGILSAIALPQYTRAVQKSRLVQVHTIANALEKALTAYIVERGERVGGVRDCDLLEQLPIKVVIPDMDCSAGGNFKDTKIGSWDVYWYVGSEGGINIYARDWSIPDGFSMYKSYTDNGYTTTCSSYGPVGQSFCNSL